MLVVACALVLFACIGHCRRAHREAHQSFHSLSDIEQSVSHPGRLSKSLKSLALLCLTSNPTTGWQIDWKAAGGRHDKVSNVGGSRWAPGVFTGRHRSINRHSSSQVSMRHDRISMQDVDRTHGWTKSKTARIAALLAVPLAWGTYGPAVELAFALPHAPPAPVLSFAFCAVSTLSLTLARLLPRGEADITNSSEQGRSFPMDTKTLRAGAELGLWIFLASNVQLLGLQATTAARAGFLVQLTTIIVPLVETVLLGRRLPAQLVGACAIAAAGAALISFGDVSAASATAEATLKGDALIGLSALLYSAHVVRLGEWAPSLDSLKLAQAKAISQVLFNCITLAGFALGGSFALKEWAGSLESKELIVLGLVGLWNGLVPSAFTTWAQSYGQSVVSPTAANLFYSSQPIWTAAISVAVLHETLDVNEFAGGACILAATLLAASASTAEQVDPIADLNSSIVLLEGKLEVLQKERDEIMKQMAEIKEQQQNAEEAWRQKEAREASELEAFKRSHTQGKVVLANNVKGKVVLDMMENVDNLARARDAIAGSIKAEDDKATLQLYLDAESAILTTLKNELNVTKIPTAGLEFDINVHEAQQKIPGTGMKPNMIVQEVQSGWKMGEFVIRHAMVVVSE